MLPVGGDDGDLPHGRQRLGQDLEPGSRDTVVVGHENGRERLLHRGGAV